MDAYRIDKIAIRLRSHQKIRNRQIICFLAIPSSSIQSKTLISGIYIIENCLNSFQDNGQKLDGNLHLDKFNRSTNLHLKNCSMSQWPKRKVNSVRDMLNWGLLPLEDFDFVFEIQVLWKISDLSLECQHFTSSHLNNIMII